MINYDLAKQLRDAGFPFQEIHNEFTLGKRLLDNKFAFGDGFFYYEPTLEELIEACGQIVLYQHPKRNTWDEFFNGLWVAGTPTQRPTNDYLCATDDFVDFQIRQSALGKTPEEAVARLYLALKEIKKP